MLRSRLPLNGGIVAVADESRLHALGDARRFQSGGRRSSSVNHPPLRARSPGRPAHSRTVAPEQDGGAIQYLVADPDSRLIVAEVDAVIAGVSALHHSGEIRLCYVSPAVARSGVGRALLVAVERHASHWGIRTLALDSTLTARAFYERCGYVSAGESKPAFGVLRCYPYLKTLST
jgi:GNAT superfamily N-acetyltransferase